VGVRIGVDIGGTFTDLVCYDAASGKTFVEKVPTTPQSPAKGCIAAVQAAIKPDVLAKAEHFLHGTTVGLNALLERRGAVVGLITTAGYRDILEIRRGTRDEPYNPFWVPPAPLVPRHLRLGVRERIAADGSVLEPVDASDVRAALKELRAGGATTIAVMLLNSYANPAHELEIERILLDDGYAGALSLSHRVSREYGEYERLSTTVVDAFVRARMAEYLHEIESDLRGAGFKGTLLLTRSGSGSMTFAEAYERPFETIMSGPVAGAEGAAELSRTLGLGDLVSADVGGTSFDTCLIVDGRPPLLYAGTVAGMPLQTPWVDVRSIGAGGGSVAHIDDGGALKVGPVSAGAVPGPACYGRGGTAPTLTDAALFLGMLGDGKLASGLVLDKSLAERALNTIAGALGYDAFRTARGVVEIICASMANAIREITVEQGVDPRALKLLAFGGAGPLVAIQLARELEIGEIIVPPYAGNFSAWGLLGADVLRAASRTRLLRMDGTIVDRCNALLDEMFAELDAGRDAGVAELDESREVRLGLRYNGQEHSLTIAPRAERGRITASAGELRETFQEAYRRSYGGSLDLEVEVTTVRAAIRHAMTRRTLDGTQRAKPVKRAAVSQPAYSFARDKFMPFRLLERTELPADETQHGPAIINEPTCTTYVDAGYRFAQDSAGCLRLIREDA
jgi:N-methylhydantoinase A